jgi:hypothetical protein
MMNNSLRQGSTVILVISWTVLAIALSGSAFAQVKPKINLLRGDQKDPATEAYRNAVDNEYKSKLKSIPDKPQKKADPWADVRSSASPTK